ncbi:MAG: hypothetical protein Q4D32_03275 [Eubacteriales bacterium]|nr:hypothetical protein [Eubacteriales bacterium]
MRGKLLAECIEKYERIEYEMKRYEKQLVTLEKQKKGLITDIWIYSIGLAISLVVVYALVDMVDVIPWIFLYFYVPVLVVFAFFTIGRSILGLGKTLASLHHHKRKDLPFQYPEPMRINSNYPTYIPPNYYTEYLCIEWLMEKYSFEMGRLKKLRREIDQASEQDYQDLQKSLDEIIIYEIVGRAK